MKGGYRDAAVYEALGFIALNDRELAKAAKLFDRVVEMAPERSQSLVGLGTVYFAQGELKHSADALQRAIGLARCNEQAQKLLALVFFELGDQQAALETGRDAIKCHDSAEARVVLASLLSRSGARTEALGVLDEFLAKEPGNARVLSARRAIVGNE